MSNKIKEQIINDLSLTYPKELIIKLFESYNTIKKHYVLKRFDNLESEAGLFVEIFRRLIEYKTENKYTPVGKSLKPFDDNLIASLKNSNNLNATEKNFYIPIIKIIYLIRNTRSKNHLNEINPNFYDSTLIVNSCNWVISEMIRNLRSVDEDIRLELILELNERFIPVVFEYGNTKRILDTSLKTEQKVLLLLYSTSKSIEIKTLCNWIEYSNYSRFCQIIKEMHSSRKIECKDGSCMLTPIGIKLAEEIIIDKKYYI